MKAGIVGSWAKQKDTARLRRTFLLIWRSHPSSAMASLALVLCQAFLPVALLFIIKQVVDVIAMAYEQQVSVPTDKVIELIVLGGVVAILESVASSARRVIGQIQSDAVGERINDLIHAKSIEVDLAFYEDAVHNDTLHRAQELAPNRPYRLVNTVQDTLRNLVSLVALAGVLTSFHWMVIPILVLSTIPGAMLRLRDAPRFYDWWRKQTARERKARYFGSVMCSRAFAQELRLYELGPYFRARFLEVRGAMRAASKRNALKRARADIVTEVISVCGLFGVFALLGTQTVEGHLTLGSLVMAFQALQRGWTHFGATLRGVTDLREDDLLLQDLYRFLDLQPKVGSPAQPVTMPRTAAPGIVLREVSFRYPGAQRDALASISLEIKAGQRVAVVGHNGSGKSTLIKLIARLYDPSQGLITLDGVDLRALALADLRGAVSVVSQDIVRYQETARDNIRFGARGQQADDRAIAAAARISGADRVIAKLSDGYDTMLGSVFEKGSDLSPGEWQKMAMARGYIRDARVVLLDEPTSAMDPKSEDEILQAFGDITRGRTSIIISHRLSTVMTADCIHVLEGGRLVESGTHAELMARNGAYARMFEIQAVRYRG